MTDILSKLKEQPEGAALVECTENRIILLAKKESAEQLEKFIIKNGFRRNRKKFKHDKYLYGMERFLDYEKDGAEILIVFQLGCRSTLHGEWVPLDRKINGSVFQGLYTDKDGICRISYEDELCYLLAKCVYTEKAFSKTDRERIEICMGQIDEEKISPKMEGVFFRFTPKLFKLIHEQAYEEVISSLLKYADY